MKRKPVVVLFLLFLGLSAAALLSFRMAPAGAASSCIDGDLNGDGAMDISDAVHILTRLFLGGPPPVACAPDCQPATLVYIVRHAEKEAGADPGLTPAGQERARRLQTALEQAPIDLLIASNFRRTQETLQPLATALTLPIETFTDTDTKAVVARIEALPPGKVVVICGHSYTIKPLAIDLGLQDASSIDFTGDAYNNLFLILRQNGQLPRLVNMTY